MRTMKRGALWTALAACCLGLAPAARPAPAAEVRWARGVAEDFFRAVFAWESEQAAGLLSPELSKVLDLPHGTWIRQFGLPWGPGERVSFESHELSPDRSEVAFRGRLWGKDEGKPVSADFKMRVAREGPGGKWCVRYLSITVREATGDKER
jgi:hypothetical protein